MATAWVAKTDPAPGAGTVRPWNFPRVASVGLRCAKRRSPGGRAAHHPFGSGNPRTYHHPVRGTDTDGRHHAGCQTLSRTPERTGDRESRAVEGRARERDRAGSTGDHRDQGQGPQNRV